MKGIIRFRTLIFFILILIAVHFAVKAYFDFDRLAGDRFNYKVIENNPDDVEVAVKRLADKIRSEKIQDYYLIMGDSVPYSGPGGSAESLAVHMRKIAKERTGQEVPIFNLSIPSAQTGDIYTLLLMLDKYKIAADRLMLDVRYSNFIKRDPGPPIVFWLKEDFRELDPVSFKDMKAHLAANKFEVNPKLMDRLETYFSRHVLPLFSVFAYRDYIQDEYKKQQYQRQGFQRPYDALGDTKVWDTKDFLKDVLKQPAYAGSFSEEPFDMTEKNENIYFLEKIIERRKNQKTLIFLAGVNDELAAEQVSTPGYQANSQLIQQYFDSKANQVKFINLQGVIPNSKFTDHVHYTAEGHKQLAEILWTEFEELEGMR